MELVVGPTLRSPPVNPPKERVGAIATELPLLILSVFGLSKLNVCAVCVGKLTVFVLGPTLNTLPLTESVGAIATELPLLILKVLGDNKFKVCAVCAGKLIVLLAGPTVSTVPVKDKLGAIATELPPEILRLLGERSDSVGVEETVKFGCVPATFTLLPGLMVTAGTEMSKELVPVLEILTPPPCGTRVVLGALLPLMATVLEPTVRTLLV